jgi:CRP/FNR family transcriptional regulator
VRLATDDLPALRCINRRSIGRAHAVRMQTVPITSCSICRSVDRLSSVAAEGAPDGAHKTSAACSGCNLREICLPFGLSADARERMDALVGRRRSVRRLEPLYRTGDPFSSLYAVRAGFFKTCVTGESGRDQVTGFQMAGELLGFDGIGTARHTCDAIALEDSQVCVIWFDHLEAVSRDSAELQHQIHKIMSREIVREHGVMLLLGGMRAEERLATFLLNLLHRLRLRGFSGSSMLLRMTREEIGSYLGLKLETVSRTFSKFQDDGVLEVKQRQLRVLDDPALRQLVNSTPC